MISGLENGRIFGKVLLPLFLFGPMGVAARDADNCESIRAALLDPQKIEIAIPEGSYTCNRPLVINRSGVRLVGQGRVNIRLADHANCPLLIMGNIETPPQPISDLVVANLTLDGNRDFQDMECWGGPCDTGGTTFIRNNGITIRAVNGASVKDVIITRARSGGMVTEKGCTKLHVDGLVAKDNYFDGFAGYETTESLFENLDLSENLGAGISLDIHFHGNIFRNSILYKNMDVGIFMRDSNRNRFQGLTVQDSGNHGVFVSQVDEQACTAPTNNLFENLKIAGAKGNGFHLNHGTCVGNQLIDASFRNVRGKEIFESVPGTLIIRTPNDCEQVLTSSVSINGWDRNFRAQRIKGMREQMLENPRVR